MKNVVNHAYMGREPGPMRVRVKVTPGAVQVTVDDRGSGMAPRPDTPRLGLGMPLIATASDRFDGLVPTAEAPGYASDSTRTEVAAARSLEPHMRT